MPPRPNQLVINLLVRALASLDPAVADRLAEDVGEEYGRSLAAQMAPGESQRSIRAAMSAVVDALTAHGFAARTESDAAHHLVVASTARSARSSSTPRPLRRRPRTW